MKDKNNLKEELLLAIEAISKKLNSSPQNTLSQEEQYALLIASICEEEGI